MLSQIYNTVLSSDCYKINILDGNTFAYCTVLSIAGLLVYYCTVQYYYDVARLKFIGTCART